MKKQQNIFFCSQARRKQLRLKFIIRNFHFDDSVLNQRQNGEISRIYYAHCLRIRNRATIIMITTDAKCQCQLYHRHTLNNTHMSYLSPKILLQVTQCLLHCTNIRLAFKGLII